MNKQMAGKEHTFISPNGDRDTGILPSERGQNNDFAYWVKFGSGRYKGKYGAWRSKKFRNIYRKKLNEGSLPIGLLGRMRILLRASKCRDKRQGYTPIKSSPEDLLSLWESQNGICLACGAKVDILNSNLDHDHDTGIPRGFLHRNCNMAEGVINRMSNEEFENFVIWERSKRYGIIQRNCRATDSEKHSSNPIAPSNKDSLFVELA